MAAILSKIFGSYNDKELKRINPILNAIEGLEPQMKKLTDKELRAKTAEFRKRHNEGESLDDLLPEAYAAIREAAVRVLGQKAFLTQLTGAIVLHQGRIAEMKTGEGKTLTAPIAAYLNALTGKGVHIVTVNEYLAKFHSEWMGKLCNFMDITVGVILHEMDSEQRTAAYNADITYGTNNEFGFDYLRDNMVIHKSQMVQRGHYFAIVDEVDSILIDEARTPLIISGRGEKSTELYEKADAFASHLKVHSIKETDAKQHDDDIDADFIVDEKARTATLTHAGVEKAERYFNLDNLSDPENATISHHINQAIKARGIMRRDIDYVVKDEEVIIVDEFTGRLMLGRRYSDGLHQAIEAKEKVKVERENRTLATITFQNYFRLYEKLAGMTGTAKTEEEEFREIYKRDVIVIPTNKPMIRKDHPDAVYKNVRGKMNAIIAQIEDCNKRGQPVLVGTVSIEKSEVLSRELKKRGIQHVVLNAKYHEKEAEIVAQAGHKGAVTIATNMAGRGTDILLGGNAEFLAKHEMRKLEYPPEIINQANTFADTDDEEVIAARKVYSELFEKYKAITDKDHDEVVALGGLFIIGTERHESRRIDNQLRGRAGRQGDAGASKFFISLEDDLMRLFGSERVMSVVETLGLEEDQPIEHKIMTGAIENAQKRIEGRNFDIRKHVLQYDDIMNVQRALIYKQRQMVLNEEDIHPNILSMIDGVIETIVLQTCGEHQWPDDWNFDLLYAKMEESFGVTARLSRDEELALTRDGLREFIEEHANRAFAAKEAEIGAHMRELERTILLHVVDQKWMDHIDAMDQLRQGVGLRAYGQHDPVMEYRNEGSDMFDAMVEAIKEDTVKFCFHVRAETHLSNEKPKEVSASHGYNETAPRRRTPVVKTQRIGRNDPCPCGSGKKYKKCCGADE